MNWKIFAAMLVALLTIGGVSAMPHGPHGWHPGHHNGDWLSPGGSYYSSTTYYSGWNYVGGMFTYGGQVWNYHMHGYEMHVDQHVGLFQGRGVAQYAFSHFPGINSVQFAHDYHFDRSLRMMGTFMQ